MRDVSHHDNAEQVIRYYLLFLPPKGADTILDIGSGCSAPYKGILQNRCKSYKSLDIRKGPNVDYVCDLVEGTKFPDNKFHWGWCVETLEHIETENQAKAVKEMTRICKNVVIAFPTPRNENFYGDIGHHVVDESIFRTFNDKKSPIKVYDKSPKNRGKGIYILIDKQNPVQFTRKGMKQLCPRPWHSN